MFIRKIQTIFVFLIRQVFHVTSAQGFEDSSLKTDGWRGEINPEPSVTIKARPKIKPPLCGVRESSVVIKSSLT